MTDYIASGIGGDDNVGIAWDFLYTMVRVAEHLGNFVINSNDIVKEVCRNHIIQLGEDYYSELDLVLAMPSVKKWVVSSLTIPFMTFYSVRSPTRRLETKRLDW